MYTDNSTLELETKTEHIPLQKDEQHIARVIAITSGKGGVGKTNIATNLGIALAAHQKKVCIFDADMGLANINIVIGKEAEYSIEDVLSGERRIDEVMMDGPGGIKIVPASSGLEKIVNLGPAEKKHLLAAYVKIESEFDYLLIDTSAGISPTVISFVQSAQDAVVVASPEPTSLTDAYSLIKILTSKGFDGNIFTLINMVLSYEDSIRIFNKLNDATKKYLNLDLKYLGYVMMDQAMIASVIQQKPIMILKPNSIACQGIASVARKLESIYSVQGGHRFSEYWKEITSIPEQVSKEQVVTTPEEVRKKFDQINTISISDLVNKVSHMIEGGNISEDEAKELIQKAENSFAKRFDKPHYNLKAVLYSSLENTNFSKENIKELFHFLETLYEKRYKSTPHDLQDVFLRLLEDSITSENKMKTLLQLIENSYRRRFKKSIHNIKGILHDALRTDDFYEDGFADLINTVKEIYFDRFGIRYKEPVTFPKADVIDILDRFKAQDKEITELGKKFSEMIHERDQWQRRLTEIVKDFFNNEEQ